MIKKSKMQSLILTQDRDFKHRAVNFLNNIAFNADKVTCESLDEALEKLQANPALLNLIIDGTTFAKALNRRFEKIAVLCSKSNLMAMLYISEQQSEGFEHHDHKIPNLLVRTLPFEKNDFNTAFHVRLAQNSGTGAPPPDVVVKTFSGGPVRPTPEQQAAAEKKPPNLIAFEASAHVRDTVNMLSKFANDRSLLENLRDAGQRFNGLVGGFAFLGDRPGWSHLRNLADIIDSVSRTYDEAADGTAIPDDLYDLVLESAKCSYLMLKELRESVKVTDPNISRADELYQRFEQTPGLKRRQSQSQEEIDDLLSQHFDKAE